MTTTIEPIKLCDADSPDWLSLRKTGISASEAAAACGISEWQTARELYHRKRGELPPIEDNRYMRLGRKLEPIIADEFEAETKIVIAERSPGLFQSSTTPHILATPDAIIDRDTLVEIKTMNDRRARDELGEVGSDEIPLEWNMQAQQQMLVMGAGQVYFAVLVGGADFRIYEVYRHDGLIESLTGRLSALWQMIESGVPPEIEDHRSNLALAKALYQEVEPGEVITLSEAAAESWAKFEACRDLSNEQKKLADQAKARVLMEIGEAGAGQLPDGRFVRRKLIEKAEYTVKASSYIDTRAVKKY